LKTYRSLVQKMPHAELMCGFVGGRKELAFWDKGELFQFYYDTIPLWGSLDDLFPKPTAEDARRSVSAGACGIYHAACHNYLFEHDYEILKSLYKGAFFVLRAKYFCETGYWIKKKGELIQVLSDEDSVILRRSMTEEAVDFEEATEDLILWSSRQILKYGENKS
ncbi:MAG: nucleotidyltransferase domain-containing protein, partial [Bacillota bacterium]|nr:nucleotidyltransferase domain-containing protein [Bacillota bacterium]